MATGTLVEFVEEMKRVLEKFRAQEGDYALAMLYNNYEGGDSDWTLIVSAPWLDSMPFGDGIRLFANAMGSDLSSEGKTRISRVSVLDTADDFVQAVNSAYQVSSPGSAVHVTSVALGGIQIRWGIVFYSQKLVAAA